MLSSGKKCRAWCDKKNNIPTVVLSENKFLYKTKTIPRPLFKLNGRSLREIDLDCPIMCIYVIWYLQTLLRKKKQFEDT